MNSCLYRCEVMHARLFPKKNWFRYKIFMFYQDLDELDKLHKKFWLFSNGRFNLFSFYDKHHVRFPFDSKNEKSVRQNLTDFLKGCGIHVENCSIQLLTNVAFLGYAFNPISIYLCFHADGSPHCAVAEVSNTHGEMKMYVLDETCFHSGVFRLRITKHFYVSPFSDLSADFDFRIEVPGEHLNLKVDSYQEDKQMILSTLTGKKKKLSDGALLFSAVQFPFISLKIILLIYWQAFILKLKGVPHHEKNIDLHLQQDMFKANPKFSHNS